MNKVPVTITQFCDRYEFDGVVAFLLSPTVQ